MKVDKCICLHPVIRGTLLCGWQLAFGTPASLFLNPRHIWSCLPWAKPCKSPWATNQMYLAHRKNLSCRVFSADRQHRGHLLWQCYVSNWRALRPLLLLWMSIVQSETLECSYAMIFWSIVVMCARQEKCHFLNEKLGKLLQSESIFSSSVPWDVFVKDIFQQQKLIL